MLSFDRAQFSTWRTTNEAGRKKIISTPAVTLGRTFCHRCTWPKALMRPPRRSALRNRGCQPRASPRNPSPLNHHHTHQIFAVGRTARGRRETVFHIVVSLDPIRLRCMMRLVTLIIAEMDYSAAEGVYQACIHAH